jgi:hypothetical protein
MLELDGAALLVERDDAEELPFVEMPIPIPNDRVEVCVHGTYPG